MNLTKAWAAQLDDYVIDLAWSPGGRLLAVASAAGPINLLDGLTGAKLHELPGHADGTNAVAFAPATETSMIKDQRSDVGGQTSQAATQTPETSGLTSDVRPLTSALLATGGQDGKVRMWDAATGQQTADADVGRGSWVEHLQWRPGAINSKSQIPNPNLLAVAAGRRLLFLNPDGSTAHLFKDAPKTLSALAWHPNAGAIAAASFGSVVIWDAEGFQVQHEYPYGSAIENLVWSPDGRWLVAGAQDNAVHLWLPAEDQEFHMSGYETKVRELSFSSDGRWLATGGARDACVWDCTGAGPEGREPVALPHPDRVCAVAFQRVHDLLATADNSGGVGLWSLIGGESRVATVKLTAPASNLAWSPDDTMLAIGSQKGGVLVLRVAT